MTSGLSPTRRSVSGAGPTSGTFPAAMAGPSPTSMSLPGVDPDKLKSRLYSYAPQQAPINTRSLAFKRPTNSQFKRSAVPSAARLEPLVSYNYL